MNEPEVVNHRINATPMFTHLIPVTPVTTHNPPSLKDISCNALTQSNLITIDVVHMPSTQIKAYDSYNTSSGVKIDTVIIPLALSPNWVLICTPHTPLPTEAHHTCGSM
jgi:hypothetical protein